MVIVMSVHIFISVLQERPYDQASKKKSNKIKCEDRLSISCLQWSIAGTIFHRDEDPCFWEKAPCKA